MSCAGPQAHPIFQPVQLNILAALEMVMVRSAMPCKPASGTCWRPSNTRCSYTSSVITNRSAATAISAMVASSAALSTVPVGLCGELTISARVRGVTARRSASASRAKPRPWGTSGTATRRAEAIATTGE